MKQENFTPSTNTSPFSDEEIAEYGITDEQIAGINSIYESPKPGGPVVDIGPEGNEAEDALNNKGNEAEDALNNKRDDESLILGKFKNNDDLAKAYQELEKKLSKGVNKGEDNESNTNTDTEDSAEEGVEADEDLESKVEELPDSEAKELTKEALKKFRETGEGMEEAFKAFEALGIPKEMVEEYAALKQKEGLKTLDNYYGEAGGKEEYEKSVDWASKNWSKEEIDTFDEIIESGSDSQIKFAIKNLHKLYQLSQKPVKKMIKADAVYSSGEGYKTQSELDRDMASPEYESNSAFRDKVYKKLRNTKFS